MTPDFKNVIETSYGRKDVIIRPISQKYLDEILLNEMILRGEDRQTCSSRSRIRETANNSLLTFVTDACRPHL